MNGLKNLESLVCIEMIIYNEISLRIIYYLPILGLTIFYYTNLTTGQMIMIQNAIV
jgi:hypothetical protein